jgi:hypothetical protein
MREIWVVLLEEKNNNSIIVFVTPSIVVLFHVNHMYLLPIIDFYNRYEILSSYMISSFWSFTFYQNFNA